MRSLHSCWEKCRIKYCVFKRAYCTSCNLVFPTWHFHPPFTCSLYYLVQDLRCSQWWGFIMRSWLGPCSLVHGNECFGGAFWGCLQRQSEYGGSVSWPKPRYPPVRPDSSITRKTIILNQNILHFPCTVSLSRTTEAGYSTTRRRRAV
jgi:hypothetical protein